MPAHSGGPNTVPGFQHSIWAKAQHKGERGDSCTSLVNCLVRCCVTIRYSQGKLLVGAVSIPEWVAAQNCICDWGQNACRCWNRTPAFQDFPMLSNEALPPYQNIFRTLVNSLTQITPRDHSISCPNCQELQLIAVQGTTNVGNMRDTKIDINSEAISFNTSQPNSASAKRGRPGHENNFSVSLLSCLLNYVGILYIY